MLPTHLNALLNMGLTWKRLLICIYIALHVTCTNALKHHLVLTNDHRTYLSVSSFGYLLGGRLEVIVKNLTLHPDPNEYLDPNDVNAKSKFGFMLIKSSQLRNPFFLDPGDDRHESCMLNDPGHYFTYDFLTLRLDPQEKKVLVRCMRDNQLPPLTPLPHGSNRESDGSHSSYKHTYTKRSAFSVEENVSNISDTVDLIGSSSVPEMKKSGVNFRLHKCANSQDLPLTVHEGPLEQKSYSFNFTMYINHEHEEGLYYLTFHNCLGRRLSRGNRHRPTTIFNLSMLVYETNFPENYLSAGVMPLPQMYLILSVMFFLIGCIWVNFITRQKESSLKIHHLMTVLVFAKSCSLLFHGINYHYIALNGQPVVTWAYLYYATRSVKGALFFITLALIGSGWSFIKHILSEKDKKLIIMIVALQVIAHIAEIVLDESTEGEASNEIWAQLSSLVDLFSCVAILFPITWSVRHLEEASRTDGKAAINLKKLEVFKKFYLISTWYIYVTRILTFIFLTMLSYKYSWLAEFVVELTTLIYFTVTGYFFQPMPPNPYLLLSAGDDDLEEDILFSVNPQDTLNDVHHLRELTSASGASGGPQDQSTLLDETKRKVTRRVIEEIV